MINCILTCQFKLREVMAFAIDIDSLNRQLKRKIGKELSVKSKKSLYNPNPKPNYAFASNRNDGKIYLPLGQYSEYLTEFPHLLEKYPHTNLEFVYELYTAETDPKDHGRDQKTVARQAIQQLKSHHTVFIAAFTNYGKTALATYLMCWSKLKTMVVCHSNILKGQWRDEIVKFTGGSAHVQIIKGRKGLDPNADIYIVGVQKASTLERKDLLDIGLVIIDEAHICTATAFTKSLLKFQPMYIVGLSATPDRRDGLDSLLYIYFGSPKEFIIREEVKDFTVVKYQTSYQPEVSYTVVYGIVIPDWSKIITSLANIEERWKEIAEIAISHPDNKIIILCDRQKMAKNIYEYLLEKGDSVEILIGNKQKWDRSKRVLVAGVKKGGIGLNDESLDMLILAADMKDVRQCEGRIRPTENLVYDIVDYYKTFEIHWKERESWYLKRGAKIVIGGTRKIKKRSKSSTHMERYLPANNS